MMFMLSASLLWPDTFASLNTRVTYSFRQISAGGVYGNEA